jgi:hypothetical protein
MVVVTVDDTELVAEKTMDQRRKRLGDRKPLVSRQDDARVQINL